MIRKTFVRTCISAGACLLALASADAEEGDEVVKWGPIQIGADFCFARTYDAHHLANHPDQLVRSIEIMGRNASRGGPYASGSLWATLHVTFRDGRYPLSFSGSCSGERDDAHTFRCKFVSPTYPDVIGQDFYVKPFDKKDLRAEATADWKAIRADNPDAIESDSYGGVPTDDRIFVLERSLLSFCHFPKGHWTARGPTKKMYNILP